MLQSAPFRPTLHFEECPRVRGRLFVRRVCESPQPTLSRSSTPAQLHNGTEVRPVPSLDNPVGDWFCQKQSNSLRSLKNSGVSLFLVVDQGGG